MAYIPYTPLIGNTTKNVANLGNRIGYTAPTGSSGEASFLKDNAPQLRAVAGLAGNLVTASKLDTNIPTRVLTNSPFTYKNRTGFLADANKANFRNYMRMRTGVPANANQAYAATLEANNKIAAVEGERQDQATQAYTNKELQINATNADAFNRNLYMNNMLKNNKTVQTGSAFNKYLENLNTLDLQQSTVNRDAKALQIMGLGLNYGRADGLFNSLQKMLESYGK